MSTSEMEPRYSVGEELANSITHAVGIVFSIIGMGVLTGFATVHGNTWHIVSCAIFGSTLIILYTASTLYHSVRAPRVKFALRHLDHAAIFLLIAGTYTPFTLVNLRGPWGWSLFGAIWGLALSGIALQTNLLRRWQVASVVLYLAMGWAVLVAIKPMFSAVAPPGLALLLIGGLAYTLGIAFYVWRRLPYHHAVWHVFVLAGSAFHFFAVLYYVIPVAA